MATATGAKNGPRASAVPRRGSSSGSNLFAIDPDTGVATALLEDLDNGDGIERQGRTLYVVQNQKNQIAVVDLSGRGDSATTRERVITNDAFDVPTTVDRFGDRHYVVNARFGTAPGPMIEYQIVGTDLH